MRFVRLMVSLVAVSVFSVVLGAAPHATAATLEECQASLSTLRQDTLDAAGAFTNGRDVTGLVNKLDNAAVKLAEGKNTDAVDKLVGYQATLASLASAPKPKVDATTASELTAQAQGTIDCIVSLGCGCSRGLLGSSADRLT